MNLITLRKKGRRFSLGGGVAELVLVLPFPKLSLSPSSLPFSSPSIAVMTNWNNLLYSKSQLEIYFIANLN